MIITRPEIAIMIIFGIMVPTGDNYSDLWLSYKFFTGNYEPAGKFYFDENEFIGFALIIQILVWQE